MAGPRRLVLARHGESANNARNVFTGIADPALTERGRREAAALGARLLAADMHPDDIFTSKLQRAADTAAIATEALGLLPSMIVAAPELNERDYGDMTGLSEDDAAARWGEGQVRRWRRSYADAPPNGESLRDVNGRLLPFFLRHILSSAMRGRTALVVAHGNCLRGLIAVLEGLSLEDIEALEIPTGAAFVYDLGPDTTIVAKTILG